MSPHAPGLPATARRPSVAPPYGRAGAVSCPRTFFFLILAVIAQLPPRSEHQRRPVEVAPSLPAEEQTSAAGSLLTPVSPGLLYVDGERYPVNVGSLGLTARALGALFEICLKPGKQGHYG